MIKRILEIMQAGKVFSNRMMAKELGIDATLLEQLTERMVQMGYLEKERFGACKGGCCSCSRNNENSCCISVLKITSKGRRAITN